MGLKYRDERKHSLDLAPYEDAPITKNQKILWGLFQIVFPWAWSRLQLISISNRWSDSEEVDFFFFFPHLNLLFSNCL